VPQLSRSQRLVRARAILDEWQLDALLVSRPAASRWLAGFVLQPMEAASSGYSGTLLVTRHRAIVLADPRYSEQAASDCDAGWEIERTEGPLTENLPRLLDGASRVGAEAGMLSHATWRSLEAGLDGVELVPVDAELERLRWVKDDDEINALERACALTDACFVHLCEQIGVGMTGRTVADRIAAWFRANGADGIAFDPLVLPGASAARPHGRSDDTAFSTGDAVLIDFGCVVDGYHSDMTRTVFLGGPSARQRELYGHVLEAQRRAEEVALAGCIASDVHAAARASLDAAGYGAAFIHGLGHGIGLEIHEAPLLKTSHEPLQVGMAFTLEPGIYLPGEIGIRIEDDYHLSDTGLRRLTRATREIIVI
jgi:Xaa-Pro aminopeptidase